MYGLLRVAVLEVLHSQKKSNEILLFSLPRIHGEFMCARDSCLVFPMANLYN